MGVRTSHLASSLYLLMLGLGIGLFLQVMVLVVQNTAAQRVRHVIAVAFAQALPPIYAYLIPLLAVGFLLALLLKEIPLRTRADLDAVPAEPQQAKARLRGRRARQPRHISPVR
jgi:hypothetical protein